MENYIDIANSPAEIGQVPRQFTFSPQNSPESRPIKYPSSPENKNPGEECALALFTNRTSNLSLTLERLSVESIKAEEINSNSEDSVGFEPVKLFINGNEEQPSPFDYIFANRSVIQLDYLLLDAEKIQDPPQNGLISRFFCCFHAEKTEKELQISKIVKMGKSYFNHKIDLHCNILMAWYSIITGLQTFEFRLDVWKSLGFSSEDPKTNELSFSGLPLIILHLLYFNERSDSNLKRFVAQCSAPVFNKSIFWTSRMMLKESINIFTSKPFKKVIINNLDSPLVCFLNLHSEIITMWTEAFDKSQDKSSWSSIRKIAHNMLANLKSVVYSLKT